jgi:hypothetical protein
MYPAPGSHWPQHQQQRQNFHPYRRTDNRGARGSRGRGGRGGRGGHNRGPPPGPDHPNFSVQRYLKPSFFEDPWLALEQSQNQQ